MWVLEVTADISTTYDIDVGAEVVVPPLLEIGATREASWGESLWSFDGIEGQNLRVSLPGVGDDFVNYATFESTIQIFDPTRKLVPFSVFEDPRDISREITLEASGLYLIRINGSRGYSILINEISTVSRGLLIPGDSPVVASIDAVGQRDEWALDAELGQRVLVTASDVGSFGPPSLTALHPGGFDVASGALNSEGDATGLVVEVGEDPLIIELASGAASTATGEYELAATSVLPTDRGVLEFATAAIGELSSSGALDRWTFEAVEAQEFEVAFTETFAQLDVTFRDAALNPQPHFIRSDGAPVFVAPSDGTYHLDVHANSVWATGTYELTMTEAVDLDVDRGPIALGDEVTGTLLDGAQVDSWALFVDTAGTTVHIDVVADPDSNLDPTVWIFGASFADFDDDSGVSLNPSLSP